MCEIDKDLSSEHDTN